MFPISPCYVNNSAQQKYTFVKEIVEDVESSKVVTVIKKI